MRGTFKWFLLLAVAFAGLLIVDAQSAQAGWRRRVVRRHVVRHHVVRPLVVHRPVVRYRAVRPVVVGTSVYVEPAYHVQYPRVHVAAPYVDVSVGPGVRVRVGR